MHRQGWVTVVNGRLELDQVPSHQSICCELFCFTIIQEAFQANPAADRVADRTVNMFRLPASPCTFEWMICDELAKLI